MYAIHSVVALSTTVTRFLCVEVGIVRYAVLNIFLSLFEFFSSIILQSRWALNFPREGSIESNREREITVGTFSISRNRTSCL